MEDEEDVAGLWRGVSCPYSYGRRPRTISTWHEDELKTYLEHRPQTYLDEKKLYLFDDFGLSVDESTIYRCLQRIGWNRKKACFQAAERNQYIPDEWKVRIAGWRPEQLVFLDESAACQRTG